jgi:hypothetical protein
MTISILQAQCYFAFCSRILCNDSAHSAIGKIYLRKCEKGFDQIWCKFVHLTLQSEFNLVHAITNTNPLVGRARLSEDQVLLQKKLLA